MTINPVKGQTATAYQGSVPSTTFKKPESVQKVNNIQQDSVMEKVVVENQKDSLKIQPDNNVEEPRNQVKSTEIEAEEIKKFISQLNKHANSSAVFGYHEETHRITIKIIDKETDEVIKEIPPEKMLDMIAKTWELAGLLVDERR